MTAIGIAVCMFISGLGISQAARKRFNRLLELLGWFLVTNSVYVALTSFVYVRYVCLAASGGKPAPSFAWTHLSEAGYFAIQSWTTVGYGAVLRSAETLSSGSSLGYFHEFATMTPFVGALLFTITLGLVVSLATVQQNSEG